MIRGVFLLALLFPTFVSAQEPIQEYIIVTAHAGEVPYQTLARTVVVLTREEIARLPARSVADLLAYTSSIDVRSRGALGVQADFAAFRRRPIRSRFCRDTSSSTHVIR